MKIYVNTVFVWLWLYKNRQQWSRLLALKELNYNKLSKKWSTIPPWQLGTVHTEGGLVKGKNIRLGFRHHMDVFKGVPFAGVPGRFEKPGPHPGWDGG